MLRLFERRTPPSPVAHIEVAHAGEVFRVALKRVSTSQRFTLRVRVASRDVLLGAMSLGLTSCTGKLPTENAAWTTPGNYTVTVTATDGFLSHSATYSLTVR